MISNTDFRDLGKICGVPFYEARGDGFVKTNFGSSEISLSEKLLSISHSYLVFTRIGYFSGQEIFSR